jgi:hypothetical protein
MRWKHLATLLVAVTACVVSLRSKAQYCTDTHQISVRIIVDGPYRGASLKEPIKFKISRVGAETSLDQVTDAKGEASIRLGVGQYKISAQPTQLDWWSETKFVTLGSADTARTLRIQLHDDLAIRRKHPPLGRPNPVSVKVSVTDPEGAVIPKATLNFTINNDTFVRTVTTDSRGEYLGKETPGNYEINVMAPGFFSDTQKVRIEESGNSEQLIQFALSPGHGSCVDVTGAMPIKP